MGATECEWPPLSRVPPGDIRTSSQRHRDRPVSPAAAELPGRAPADGPGRGRFQISGRAAPACTDARHGAGPWTRGPAPLGRSGGRPSSLPGPRLPYPALVPWRAPGQSVPSKWAARRPRAPLCCDAFPGSRRRANNSPRQLRPSQEWPRDFGHFGHTQQLPTSRMRLALVWALDDRVVRTRDGPEDSGGGRLRAAEKCPRSVEEETP